MFYFESSHKISSLSKTQRIIDDLNMFDILSELKIFKFSHFLSCSTNFSENSFIYFWLFTANWVELFWRKECLVDCISQSDLYLLLETFFRHDHRQVHLITIPLISKQNSTYCVMKSTQFLIHIFLFLPLWENKYNFFGLIWEQN